MNNLVIAAMNLGILTLLFFIVGMIKPRWALFFMDKPNRFIIAMVTTVLVMVTFTMLGEGRKREIKVDQWTKVPTLAKPAGNAAAAPVPVPESKTDLPTPAPTLPVATPPPAPTAVPAPATAATTPPPISTPPAAK